MGYYTTVTGRIDITPPLPWSVIKNSPFLPSKYQTKEWRDVVLDVAEKTVETEDGTLLRKSGVAIVPRADDSYKAYSIEMHVQELVNAVGSGYEFSGWLEGNGEENTDIWRIGVQNGRVVKVVAKFVWPDGEEIPSQR